MPKVAKFFGLLLGTILLLLVLRWTGGLVFNTRQIMSGQKLEPTPREPAMV